MVVGAADHTAILEHARILLPAPAGMMQMMQLATHTTPPKEPGAAPDSIEREGHVPFEGSPQRSSTQERPIQPPATRRNTPTPPSSVVLHMWASRRRRVRLLFQKAVSQAAMAFDFRIATDLDSSTGLSQARRAARAVSRLKGSLQHVSGHARAAAAPKRGPAVRKQRLRAAAPASSPPLTPPSRVEKR
ncbi:uncharacterized protein BDZ99DRAFT_499150 [Mytilinidion resinicola]|uniref:Uncharacterized protein n=1 Tax=Mytilinidion resinicola TaxID=574789 RepID=A0A6A6YIP9_9PEZI|nr:uncharacterized protein BDZ99DRAFT_499150 [Mytilinidion resinicola]KAF2808732.1 hypothetical protein BDZ99DRAFT_499150 [Mytilinidion resinicola]